RVEEDPRCAGRLSRIALDVRIGRYAPLGLYDLIVPLADGSSATLREQVNLICLELVREVSAGSGIFTYVSRSLISHPVPKIELRIPSEVTVKVDGNILSLHVSGEVFDAVADVVAGGLADIKYVMVGDSVLSVERDRGYEHSNASPVRPYAFRGIFSGTVSLPACSPVTPVVVRTSPNATGSVGYASATLSIEDNSSAFRENNIPNIRTILFKTDGAFDPASRDAVYCKALPGEEFAPLLETGEASVIFEGAVPGLGSVKLRILSSTGDEGGTRDLMVCELAAEHLRLAPNPIVLEETSAASNLFSLGPFVEISFPGAVSEEISDVAFLRFRDSEGSERIALLSETAPASFVFEAKGVTDLGAVRMRFDRFSLDDGATDRVSFLLSCSGRGWNGVAITLGESSAGSRRFALGRQCDAGQDLGIIQAGIAPTEGVSVKRGGISVGSKSPEGAAEVYLIEVRDVLRSSDEVRYGDRSYPLFFDADVGGAIRRTSMPIMLVDRPTYRTPASPGDGLEKMEFDGIFRVENPSEGRLSYNPDKIVVRGREVKSFFPGPFYLYRDRRTFDAKQDGIIVYGLSAAEAGKPVRIVIYPKDAPDEAVVDLTFEAGSEPAKEGTHRVWDGTCNVGKDADGKPNAIGGSRKFIDPGPKLAREYVCDRYVGGKRVASTPFSVSAKRVWLTSTAKDLLAVHFHHGVFGQLKPNGDLVDAPHFPEGDDDPEISMFMGSAESFRSACARLTPRSRLIVTTHGYRLAGAGQANCGQIILTSKAFSELSGELAEAEKKVSELRKERDALEEELKTFGEVVPPDKAAAYDRVWKRYEAIEAEIKGAEEKLLAELNRDIYAGFALEGRGGGTGSSGLQPYRLPPNIMHGLHVELRACWSADKGPNGKSVAQTLCEVLNGSGPTGSGTVIGCVGMFRINMIPGCPKGINRQSLKDAADTALPFLKEASHPDKYEVLVLKLREGLGRPDLDVKCAVGLEKRNEYRKFSPVMSPDGGIAKGEDLYGPRTIEP
ncbi:MAG: hypothetical protein N3A38_13250, partial [Planctomycetota bacterium]|nr:hypothetical protein [Planctomycetota bacterium]